MPKKSSKSTKAVAKTTALPSNFDFQKQYDALEKITEEFEAGNYSLEVGLKKFEEGLQIAQQLKAYLEEVENTIQTIKGKYNEFASKE